MSHTVAFLLSFYAYCPLILPKTLRKRPIAGVLPMKSESEKGGALPRSSRLSDDKLPQYGWENAIAAKDDDDDPAEWTDTESERDESSSSDDDLVPERVQPGLDDLVFERVQSGLEIPHQRSLLTDKLKNPGIRAASNPERLVQTSSPFVAKPPKGSPNSLAGVADSARDVRNSMVPKEMSESLGKHVVREHKDKTATVDTFQKRKGTTVDPKDSFAIPQDYHQVGW